MAEEIPETLCNLDTSVPNWLIDHPETLSVLREVIGVRLRSAGH